MAVFFAAKCFAQVLDKSFFSLQKFLRANIRRFYFQRFCQDVLPALHSTSGEEAHSSGMLSARMMVYASVPSSVYSQDIPQLLPDIVSVLSLGDDQSPSVTRLALLLVSELFKEGSDNVLAFLPRLVPMLGMLCHPQHSVTLRLLAIRCLHSMLSLPPAAILPFVKGVTDALKVCLDDPKRAVRVGAVETRNAWFLVKE